MDFKNLMKPIKLRDLEVPNRVILPAMGSKMSTVDGFVTDRLINYLKRRAEGGCGLIVTEVSSVHPTSNAPGFLRVDDDIYIDGLKKLTSEIHKYDSKIGIQLWHGGFVAPMAGSVAPSAFSPVPGRPGARELSLDEIKDIISSYGQAARRAVEAGFDCVEFHMGHGYLPQEFFSPFFNKRTDEYGGSFEKRCKFPLECIKEIRKNIPSGMPILMRIISLEDVDGGFTTEDIIKFANLAKEKGVDLLDISRGVAAGAAVLYEVPPIDIPKSFNVEKASEIRKSTGLPVAAVGRINDPYQAEEILSSNKADMVVIGRGQLADPDFCNKVKEGRASSIIKCIGCDQGCFDGFCNPKEPFISCMLNPFCGREDEFKISKTSTPKNILIAGAGPAGLNSAIILKERGHNPVVFEKSNQLGGQFLLAGAAPRKEEMADAASFMGERAKRLGVEIILNKEVTGDIINELNPDEVIIAIGGKPLIPNIARIDNKFVVNSHDLLADKVNVHGNVAVIGGGLVGLEVAEKLSSQGCKVKIIEMLPEIGADLGMLRKISVMGSIYGSGTEVFTSAKCLEINEGSIKVETPKGINVLSDLDYVVLAVGAKSNDSNDIVQACKENNIPYHIIGDALKPRRTLNAVFEAVDLSLNI